MAYCYTTERPFIFTEEGQIMFLRVRDKAQELLKLAGAVSASRLIAAAGSGSSWSMLACIDRLVELKEIEEIPNPISRAGQHRLFVRLNDL